MTKINRMVLDGFKSFAKHTEIVFGDGFNCVLGPNGSGKSNILDALCFVLGRMSAKSMRAERSANLIYNGGKTKEPAKQGEVSLYFDNSKKAFPLEKDEVKITRIIKHDGQSVYKINDEKSTRQQILDLMGTARIDPGGFNIVLQGDIVRFTEMHLDERRMIIEEISGISVYEEKKEKALRELDRVDERLKEAAIILTERNSYLKDLKKDRDQALKFKDLQSKLKENKASYLYIQIDDKQKEQEKHDSQINVHQEKINKINEGIAKIRQSNEEKKKLIDNINREIEEKGEKGQIEVQKEIEKTKVGIATNKTRIDGMRGEIDKIGLRKKQLESDLEENNKKIDELKKEIDRLNKNKSAKLEDQKKLESKISKFRQDNALNNAADLEKQIEEIDKKSEEKQKEIDIIRKEQQELIRKKDSLEFQLRSTEEKIDKVLELEKENKEQIEKLKQQKEEFKKSILKLNQKLADDSGLARQIADQKRMLQEKEEELAKLNAKQAGIKESSLGDIAIKNILDLKKNGVYGTIRGLGNVKEKFSLALEVSAGQRINSIVVDDDKIAADCIKHLKSNKLGSATFIPLNKIKPREPTKDIEALAKEKGVEGFAIDLISFDPKFEKAFSYLFGDTLVVDDIDISRRLGIGNARMATLTGDLIEISGSMHGGYVHRKKYGFSEEEVINGIENCKKRISELQGSLAVFDKKKAENEEEIFALRTGKAEMEGEIIKGEKSLHLESGDLESSKETKKEAENQIEKVSQDISSVEAKINLVVRELTNLKIKKQELRSKVTSLRSPELLAELNAFEEKRNELIQEIMGLDSDIKTFTTELNGMRLPEKGKFEEILKNLSKEKAKFSEEVQKLLSLIERLDEELKQKEENAKEFYLKYKELFVERTKVQDEVGAGDNKIDKLRDESKDEEIKLNQVSLINAEVKAKLAGLREEFSQYEGTQINPKADTEELKREIAKYEKMSQEVGSVNMRALEIYDEVEKEYNSLLGKKDKLSQEKDDVVKMMEEIDSRKRELFMKSFNVINEKFKEFFLALSIKGEAFLELENEEKPFEGGLDIKVRITGKKFLDIRGLSGGEKTMTALAFIFAIQEYQPHSFYILDEVDAALDKHNSEKLALLVRKYVERAQYIVISHNDSIITEADNLYGISMNEHGISNVVTLRI